MTEMTLTIDPAYECNDGRVGCILATFDYVRPSGKDDGDCEGYLALDEMTVEFYQDPRPFSSPHKNIMPELTPAERGRIMARAAAVARVWFNGLSIGGVPT